MSKAGKVQQPVKLNAAQRIAGLEVLVANMATQIEILADENDKNRQLITSLAKRINATIKAGEDGNLSGDSVNKLILDENVKELESKIKFLIDRGVLKEDKETEITEKTFVVGRDVDAEGNVVNPRVQFAVGSVNQELQTQFLGHKAGDLVKNGDGTSFEITEVYKIVDPKVNKEFPDEKPEAPKEGSASPEASGSEVQAES